jgi:hypothetical protein
MKFFTEMFYDTKLGAIEFHFERVDSPSARGYHVVVSCGTANIYDFLMWENKTEWKFVQPSRVPEWVGEYETLLSDSIKAHLMRGAVLN